MPLTATAKPLPHAPSAFSHRQFRFFWISAIVSNSGTWMQQVAVFAAVYDLSGRQGKWLGLVGLASALPNIALTPIAGVLADRVSRRLVLIVTQLIQAVAALALWLLHLAGALTPWRIVAAVFAGGVASGFQVASWQSFVPTLVPRENLIEAVRLNSLQFTLSRAIGPTVGALFVKLWGTGSAFVANAATYLIVIAAIAVARPDQVIERRSGQSFRAVFVEGARYVARDRALRLIVLFTFLVSALGQSLMTIAAAASDQLFGHSPEDNAWLVASVGAGSAVASVIVLSAGARARRTTLTRAGLAVYTVGLALIPLTGEYAVGLAGYALTGAAHMLVATSLNTFVQGTVPDHIRGRVLSFYLLGVMLGFPIGGYLLGAFGDALGLRPVLVADVVAFALVTTWVVRRPVFAQLDAEDVK